MKIPRVAALFALALAAVLPARAAADAEARQVYGIVWKSRAVESAPCLLSVVLPASESERCTSWTRRESAGPAFHPALGIVVVGGSDRLLHGLDGRDGRVLWKTSLPGALVAQPVIVDDVAYLGTEDAHALEVDVATGAVRWDIAVDAEITEPAVIDKELVFVVTGADTLYALRRGTGEVVWLHKHPLPRGITLRGQARPLVASVSTTEGEKVRVFVGHASGRLSVLDRDTGAAVTELDLSKDDTFGDLDADPVEVGGRIVAASYTRGVVGLDPRTLTEAWRNSEPGIVRLARGGDNIVVMAGSGKVVGVDVQTGKNLWRYTFKKGAPTRIVVQGGRVHVGSDRGALYVLDLASGRPLQYAGSGLGVAGDLDLWNDMLFFTTTGGTVLALSGAWDGPVQATPDQGGR